MCVTGVFLLSNTYHAVIAEVADTIDDSTVLFHAGIWLAIDECGITQESLAVDDSCRTQVQPIRAGQIKERRW